MQDTPESRDSEIRLHVTSGPRARRLVGMLDRLQLSLYPAESNHLDPVAALERDEAAFYAAFVADEAVGCGAVKRMPPHRTSPRCGEIKRMHLVPEVRGQGMGAAPLDALESSLISQGLEIARLETGVRQPDASALYEGRGYARIPLFRDCREGPLSVFYERRPA